MACVSYVGSVLEQEMVVSVYCLNVKIISVFLAVLSFLDASKC